MSDDGLWRGWDGRGDAPGGDRPGAVVRRRRRVAAVVAAVVALVVVVVVVAGGGPDDAGPAPTGVRGKQPTGLLDALAPVLGTGAKPGSGAEGADAQLGIPLDRAAAQLFVVGLAGTGPTAPFLKRLRVRDWGAVVLTRANWAGSSRRFAALVTELRRTARRAGHTPPLVAALAAGERDGTVPGAGPRAGAAAEPTRDAARRAGRVLERLGVDAVLGPPLDLAYAGGPARRTGLPEDPALAAGIALAAVQGWQEAGVLAFPGHFPGEGAAAGDPSAGPASVGLSLPQLRVADVKPFAAAAPRTRAVQMSSALYGGFDGVTPASLLPEAIALLREVDPDAVAISADLQALAATTGASVADSAVAALQAGCDLLLLPGDAADQEAAFRAVVRATRTGQLPSARIAEALRRLALLKRGAGVARAASG